MPDLKISMKQHETWMREAIRLAEKGRDAVSPNPMVGCCVVRQGRCVGAGYHRRYGGPHAEIHALRSAGRRAQGATLYVTLEPCSTWGKTPPCVQEVIRSGVREVVVGSADPNPANRQKGIRALRRAGIRVISGILADEVRAQNEAFFKFIRKRVPFVTLKMAQTLDGKIAVTSGASRWISSPPARSFVRRLRAVQDALLVGKNTLVVDNPRLAVPRRPGEGRRPEKPWRIVLDPDGKISSKARIFLGPQITILAVSENRLRNGSREESFSGGSRILLPVPERNGYLDMETLLRKLGKLGVARLLVEGGGELAWSLLRGGLVDKAYWIVAPKVFGGRCAKTSVEGEGVPLPSQGIRCNVRQVSRLGDDWLFETYFRRRKA